MIAELADHARRAADAATALPNSTADAQHYISAVEDLDTFGLRAMTAVLREALPDNTVRDEDEIAAHLRVAPRHRWLLRRWLTELTARRWLSRQSGGSYRALREQNIPARSELREVCADLGFAPELAQFFARANRALPELLRDRVLAQELLFPDGDFRTAEAAYRTNPINHYLNAATREIITWAVHELEAERAPVRILELGAGVGGTTADIVAALSSSPVDYHFTDLSKFFLDTARGQFAAYPWMRYGIVDLNADLPQQPPCDIVLAANVLHNAQHCGRMLHELRELLAPGGFLIFVESCREHCQLLTSMHFLMSPKPGATPPGGTDIRAGTDRIFLSEPQWLDQLTLAGLQPQLMLPDADHPLATLGQRVFLARKRP
ncbi:class I SAM-dependent methyltransferase [Nocardia pseudovaccinii]|uniref:class I SAM-dependent methyltransferase n=1 Tax=Nocardia pseudovaccinii TaxID=189540 RepID=UPI0007A3F984|nr:class I SAM-dependent methyltransferase [Nocardia pseudovaccinii]